MKLSLTFLYEDKKKIMAMTEAIDRKRVACCKYSCHSLNFSRLSVPRVGEWSRICQEYSHRPFLSINEPKMGLGSKKIFLIADMHCFTKPEKCFNISIQINEVVRGLLAAGINPKDTLIVQQSKILEHANLAWYLSCLTKYSRAENMTQFKSNFEKHPNIGLFIYPILQAADILIYNPDYVLVGPDQKQHLELTSELCNKMNRFLKFPLFKRPIIIGNNIRIKNLKDGTGKMSKSDPLGCLFLDDSPETIRSKISKSKTDSHSNITYDKDSRENLASLVEIMASLKDSSPEEIAQNYGHLNHSQFKHELSNILVNYFEEFRVNYNSLKNFPVQDVISEGSLLASKIASLKFSEFLEHLNK